jgi:GGDEF domain-containing protein
MLIPKKIIGLFNGNGNLAADVLLPQDQFQRAIEKERIRSDRGEHEYSLLVLTPNLDEKKQAARLRKIVLAIRKMIRDLDEVGWYDKKQLGIILPYTSREGAEQLAHKICEKITPHVNASGGVLCEVFCYQPKDVDSDENP